MSCIKCFPPNQLDPIKKIPFIISVGSSCCQAKPVKLNHLYVGGKLADIPPIKQDYAFLVPWENNTKQTTTSSLSR